MDWIADFLIPLFISLVFAVGLLAGAAYLTWFERKVCARFQVRYGPNRAGPFGLLQPIADAIKAFMKEEIIPDTVDKLLYVMAPGLMLVISIVTFGLVPMSPPFEFFGYRVQLQVADVNIGVLYFLAMAGLATYSVFLAGWSSNNKYSLLGALRTSAQMISYELPMGLALVSLALVAGTLTVSGIVENQRWIPLVVLQPVGAIIYFICAIAETNRSPFDLPETENELVSGFLTEYGGMKFALFYVTEYANVIVASAIIATLFLGGWQWPAFLADLHPVIGIGLFAAKVIFVAFLYVWIRSSQPRVRYDKLMRFSWKYLFPLALINLAVTATVVAVV